MTFSLASVCYLLYNHYREWQFFHFVFNTIKIYDKEELEEWINRKAVLIMDNPEKIKKHIEKYFNEEEINKITNER